MALNKDSKHQYRVLLWNNNETESAVSDAIFREFYGLHSLHVSINSVAEVTIQVSNLESPAENTDTDWVEYDKVTASTFIPINMIFRWIRVKRDASTDPVTVMILSGSRANT